MKWVRLWWHNYVYLYKMLDTRYGNAGIKVALADFRQAATHDE